MVIHSKISSGGTSATAGRSSRAESNQALMNDTKVKVEVEQERGIDEINGNDHGEEKQDGRDGYISEGVLEDDDEKRDIRGACESRTCIE